MHSVLKSKPFLHLPPSHWPPTGGQDLQSLELSEPTFDPYVLSEHGLQVADPMLSVYNPTSQDAQVKVVVLLKLLFHMPGLQSRH